MESFMDVLNMVKEHCRDDLSNVAFDCWIKPIQPLKLEENIAYLQVANPFQKNILDTQYRSRLERGFLDVIGFPVTVVFEVDPDYEQKLASVRNIELDVEDPGDLNHVLDFMQSQEDKLHESIKKANYAYTFDTFIVGNSNNFAYAACKAVCKDDNSMYNPLFIHGPSGLGKTHLLCAIQHEFQKNHPTANIVYVNSETFTIDLIENLKNKTIPNFHRKYRNADILLLDDVQFIGGKESTQEEFFHTFNELHQAGKQIVLTSDRPPKDIKTLEERLRTRFEWGLITDIGLPDMETRVAIIKRKAELLHIVIPDDIAQYLATKLKSNIRQLEGAVNKIKAYKYLAGSNPSITVAQTVIKEILNDNQPEPVTVDRIIEEVAKTYSVSPEDIRSKKRTSAISHARQVSIYVVREITQMSQAAIGNQFGGRDHATVLYAIQTIQKMIERDSHTKAIVDDIIKNIRGH